MADDVLEVISGKDLGARFALRGPEALIGRDPVSEFVLTDPRVSRRHARVWLEGGVLMVEDIGSTGGTSVNGAPIERPTPLAQGDRLTMGVTQLRVLWAPALAPTLYGPAIEPDGEYGRPPGAPSSEGPAAGPSPPPDVPAAPRPVPDPFPATAVPSREAGLAPPPPPDAGAAGPEPEPEPVPEPDATSTPPGAPPATHGALPDDAELHDDLYATFSRPAVSPPPPLDLAAPGDAPAAPGAEGSDPYDLRPAEGAAGGNGTGGHLVPEREADAPAPDARAPAAEVRAAPVERLPSLPGMDAAPAAPEPSPRGARPPDAPAAPSAPPPAPREGPAPVAPQPPPSGAAADAAPAPPSGDDGEAVAPERRRLRLWPFRRRAGGGR